MGRLDKDGRLAGVVYIHIWHYCILIKKEMLDSFSSQLPSHHQFYTHNI